MYVFLSLQLETSNVVLLSFFIYLAIVLSLQITALKRLE